MQEATLIEVVAKYVVDRLRSLAPKDTGNLAFNSIKVILYKRTAHITVDLKQAPYMPYTNEPWISDKWKGKKNPNEAWWNNAMQIIMQELAQMLEGELENVRTE